MNRTHESSGDATGPELDIRLVRENEIADVAALTVDAYTSAYDLSDSADYVDELGRVAHRARAQQVWVARDRSTNALLGTVTTPLVGERLSSFAETADMDFRMLAVAPNARGRGIGRALVEHCTRLARDRGAARLVLHTGADMQLAVSLYERMGFERLTDAEENFSYPPGVWYPVRVYAMTL